MNNFKTIELNNLELISNKIYEEIIAWGPLPQQPLLYYIDDRSDPSADRFKSIVELSDQLKTLKIYDHWICTAIVVCYEDGGYIHKDSGSPEYSLLIPVKNTANTYTVFYEVTQEPTVLNFENTSNNTLTIYYKYPAETSKEIERVETVKPTLLRVKTPHGVTVNSNIFPRITVSLRLDEKFNIADL
jgi:hypothetical protein